METLKKIRLYFLPGIIPTLLLILCYGCFGEQIPSMTLLVIIDFVITIPLFILIISREMERPFGFQAIREIFATQNCVMFWPTLGRVLLSFLWAVGIFIILKPINIFLLETVFYWIPEWFAAGLTPGQNDRAILKFTWFLLLPFSILMPVMEEIYFRGFLLRREKFDDWRSPLINTVLFCAYHLWSPWLFLTRVIAIFPMNYFAWRWRNISLSIIPHVLLNLLGDVVLLYPLIFNPVPN